MYEEFVSFGTDSKGHGGDGLGAAWRGLPQWSEVLAL